MGRFKNAAWKVAFAVITVLSIVAAAGAPGEYGP